MSLEQEQYPDRRFVIFNTSELPNIDFNQVYETDADTVRKSVKKGEDVKLVGFGTFTKAKRKARTGRNPQTGKAIKIPAAWHPKFRPGAEFKALVR